MATRLGAVIAILSLVGALTVVSAPAADAAWAATTRASEGTGGIQGDGPSYSGALSWDGRFVVFASDSTNLVTDDANGVSDIFIRDRTGGTTSRVSIGSGGIEANGASTAPSISGDGRFVAFTSEATNFVADDTNAYSDVFIRDTVAGTTERVSTSTAGDNGNLPSGAASVSWDGRFVAFYSLASNLVAGDTNGWWDVFVKDRQNGYTQRVSVASDGTEGDNMSYEPAISFDGRYVTFTSMATNLAGGDTNSADDIYVRDRILDTTERVSVSSSGVNTDAGSFKSSVSYDGRYISYESIATNVITDDTNGSWDVFVRDNDLDLNQRVSVADDGSQAEGESKGRAISADGQRVSFRSAGSMLVAGDANFATDAFVRDRNTATTARSSIAGVVEIDANAVDAVLAGDGRTSAFVTAGGFPGVIADTNGVDDVYVSESGEAPLTTTPSPTSLPELTPGPPPAAPTGMGAVPASDTQIDLSWTDNSSDETLFKIERRPVAGDFVHIADVGTDATAYSDTGLSPSTSYAYRVQSANPDARSGYSNEITATTFAAVPPDAPSDLTATAVTGVRIDLNWVDNSTNELGFKVDRKVEPGGYVEITPLPSNAISYSDTGLAPLTTYWYRARAWGFAGDSGYSNEISATTLVDVPPVAPASLEVLTTTADQAHLSWSDTSANETGFEVERSEVGGTFAVIGSVGADATTFLDAGLKAATRYDYRVRAVNTGGASGPSNTASATTKPAPVCKKPQVLFSSNRTGRFQIFAMNEDGTGLRRVSQNEFNETRPVYVPGQDRIVFASDEYGNPDIFSMNLDGSNRTRLTSDPGTDANPVVSGAIVAFESDRSGLSQIWMMNLDGSSQTPVTSHASGASSPAFAPAVIGNQLAFQGFETSTSTFQVYTITYTVAPFTGTVPVRINPSDASNQGQPSYSPDGTKIAYISDVEDAQFDIYTLMLGTSARTRLTFDTNFEARPWFSHDAARVLVASDSSGDFEIHALTPAGSTILTSSASIDIDPSDAVAGPWAVAPSANFLAEGASAGGFETWILLSNPDPVTPVTACITYLTSAGAVQGPAVTIPPQSRRSERVGATVETFNVSTVVEGLDGDVLAERAVYSTRPDTAGAHVGRAAPSPAYEWHAAEGSTAGGFETWVLIANPSRTDTAVASVDFLTASGVVPGPQSFAVAPGVRQSYRVSDYAPGQFDVASQVTSTGAPVLVERASYVNAGRLKGATDSPAVTSPGTRWFLAEGAAAGSFETWILVSNPQLTPTNIDIKYLTPAGERPGPAESIPARSRRSYNVADSGFITYNVSTDVSASAGVVVERAMYVNDAVLGRGASTGEGVDSAGVDWLAVEGASAGGFTTWILIANPNAVPACVDVKYLTAGGPVDHTPGPVCLPARSRRSLRVNDQVITFDVSTGVASTTGTDPTNGVSAATAEPVIVERAVYTPAGPSQDSTAGPAIKLG